MTVECGKMGYHSGEVGGIVPETFRIMRELVDRLDDSSTGKVLVKELDVPVPDWKIEEAKLITELGGNELYEKYALVDGAKYCS